MPAVPAGGWPWGMSTKHDRSSACHQEAQAGRLIAEVVDVADVRRCARTQPAGERPKLAPRLLPLAHDHEIFDLSTS